MAALLFLERKSQLISFPVRDPCAYSPLPGIFFPWIIPWLASSFVKTSNQILHFQRGTPLQSNTPFSLYPFTLLSFLS